METPAAFPGCAQGRPAQMTGPGCQKKIPVRDPVFIPKGWPLLTAPRIGQGFWGRPAVLCALLLSPPQMLVHIYIPHNRTPCGRGLCRGSLTDSRGSHRLSSSSLGRLCSPSLICVLIIPHFWRLVKTFFIFFGPASGEKGSYLSPFSSAHCWYSSMASHSASWASQ